MADYHVLTQTISGHPVILAPRRNGRPDAAKGTLPICPFCPGNEDAETEHFRIGGEAGDGEWLVRVIPNKFPFTPSHELIIHAPDHHKNFEELPKEHVELILKTYKERYNEHTASGNVVIFHNRGQLAGESVPHAHTQLTVVPFELPLDTPPLPEMLGETVETESFSVFAPVTAQWPDEIWIAPKERRKTFGEISEDELLDLAFVLPQIIRIEDLRHGHELPFNFYISPGKDWYIRIIPRSKLVGGFEVATGIFVNTQDPQETMQFIKMHLLTPNEEQILTEQQAHYRRGV